jgi:hypothetical protein
MVGSADYQRRLVKKTSPPISEIRMREALI